MMKCDGCVLILNRAMHKLQSDFQSEIGSLGSDVIDTNRMSSGTKIRHIFHQR